MLAVGRKISLIRPFLTRFSMSDWFFDVLKISDEHGVGNSNLIIFLLTGLRIYTGEYKAQGPTLCPTEGRALRGPRALYSPV